MITSIGGRTFFLNDDGKVSWGTDERGWHVDVFEIVGDREVPVGGKYGVGAFRKRLNNGKIVVR